jgi:hypothetical protein
MQTGHYPRMFGPSFVFVRYRCSRCKKHGEQFVKQEEWDAGIFRDSGVEFSSNERERFATLGPIEMRELADFHHSLESLSDLSTLNTEFADKSDDKQDSKTDKGEK